VTKHALEIVGWISLAAFGIMCGIREPEGWLSVFLLSGWLASAIWTVWFSQGHRKRTGLIVLVSGALIWNTVVYLLSSYACAARNDCV
jgi:hypothetical protein